MYGMINQAIAEYASVSLGAEAWKEISTHLGMPSRFMVMGQYPDKDSVALLQELARRMGTSIEEVMEEVGRRWVGFAQRMGYAEILRMAGADLFEGLENLNLLHDRLMATFEHMRAPSFCVSDQTEQQIVLHYQSHRQGLAPLVVGLIKGWADALKTPITIEHVKGQATGYGHEVFLIHKVHP